MRQALTRCMDGRADESPLDIAADVFEIVRRESGVEDPYASAKAACAAEARKWLPVLHENLQSSEDPLALAMKIAAIGNIMDYGALATFDVSTLLEQAHDHQFAVDARQEFEARLASARTLSYFFFLFIVKCELVAAHVNGTTGHRVSKGDLFFGANRSLEACLTSPSATS